VAFVRGLGQRLGNAGAHANHRRSVDAELHGDGVGGLEADAANVAGQAIWADFVLLVAVRTYAN
jgi:hypothetical protein